MRRYIAKAALAATLATFAIAGTPATALAADGSARPSASTATAPLQWIYIRGYIEWGKCELDGVTLYSSGRIYDYNCYWNGSYYELWILDD